MIITWMLYGVLVATLAACGAAAAEWLGRAAGYAVRWVWVGALVFTLALIGIAPMRRAPSLDITLPAATLVTSAKVVVRPDGWTDRLALVVRTVRASLTRPLIEARVALDRASGGRIERPIGSAWAGITSILIVALIGGQLRLRRARRRWPLTDLQGVRVRIAPSTGPLVIGVTRPEIVVPQWLLGREPHEQRLVIAHEAEHVRAFDTVLLALGCLALALVPWCVPVWYMFSRLRLAIELDCDARVLRGGATPRSYGELLIDVAEQGASFRIGATALVAGSSHLQRRLMAMKRTAPRFALARGGFAVALATLALLAACEAKLPTSAEVNAMDGRTAETQARKLALATGQDTNLTFVVDNVVVTKAEANAYKPDDIASIEIAKSAGGQGKILIRTKKAAQTGADTSVQAGHLVARKATGDTAILKLASGAVPLIFIDGVRSTNDDLQAIDPKQIESIEVLKGPAAARDYKDAAAANGVISVKTKKAP